MTTWLWCEKRQNRIALEVCRYRKCRHLQGDTCKKKPKFIKKGGKFDTRRIGKVVDYREG